MHALIVAGPSGAGKSTFVAELYAGRLAADIRQHLPSGSETWPLLDCCAPEHWGPILSESALPARTAGITVHYDVTSQWWRLKQDLAQDPLWPALRRCEAVTLVLVQPPLWRLLRQWSQDRLGMSPWQVHARRMLAKPAWSLLRGIRRLRTLRHPRFPERMRYPRPVRFLKHVDRALRSYRRPVWTGQFDFYRCRQSVDQMLRSWNEVVAAETAGILIKRIELVPDPAARIGKTFGWHVRAAKTIDVPTASTPRVLRVS